MRVHRVVLVSLTMAVLVTAGSVGTTMAASPTVASSQPIITGPNDAPPLPAGVQIISAGFGTPASGGGVAPKPLVRPMAGCLYNCVHIRNVSQSYLAYYSRGPVAEATNWTSGTATLSFTVSYGVSNSYSATTSLKIPLGPAEVSAGVGFSVTYSNSYSYTYSVQAGPYKTVCLATSAVFKGYTFRVYHEPLIGSDEYWGTGWAENYNRPYFVSYYC